MKIKISHRLNVQKNEIDKIAIFNYIEIKYECWVSQKVFWNRQWQGGPLKLITSVKMTNNMIWNHRIHFITYFFDVNWLKVMVKYNCHMVETIEAEFNSKFEKLFPGRFLLTKTRHSVPRFITLCWKCLMCSLMRLQILIKMFITYVMLVS